MAQSLLTRSCWRGDLPLQINLGLFNPETCPARLDITIKEGTNILERHSSTVELASGPHRWTLKWSPQRWLPTGEYGLELNGEGCGRSFVKLHNFTVLNPEDVAAVRNDLLELEEDINCIYPGAVHTALANLDWLEQELSKSPWELCDLSGFYHAREMRDQLRNGTNPLGDKPGLTRRAFRSQKDGILQPYSLYLPKGFTAERKWPLLMVLHGIEVDEKSIAANPNLHKLADKLGIVLLFPKARNACGYYLDSETDILHNLTILKKRLPLDWDKLFLAGVSMGGFGTWHIGLRNPGHFSGLAVVSGIPSLPFAGKDIKPGYVFHPANYVDNAKKLLLLIIHGTLDTTVPPELVRDVVSSLRENGVKPIYKEVANGGHGNFDWHSDLAAWIKPLIKK